MSCKYFIKSLLFNTFILLSPVDYFQTYYAQNLQKLQYINIDESSKFIIFKKLYIF